MTDLNTHQVTRRTLLDSGAGIEVHHNVRTTLIERSPLIKARSCVRLTLVSGVSATALELQAKQLIRLTLVSRPVPVTYEEEASFTASATLTGNVVSAINLVSSFSGGGGTLTADLTVPIKAVRAFMAGSAFMTADTSLLTDPIKNATANLYADATMNANAVAFSSIVTRSGVASGVARIQSKVRNMIPKLPLTIPAFNYILNASAALSGEAIIYADVFGGSFCRANLVANATINADLVATRYVVGQLQATSGVTADATINTHEISATLASTGTMTANATIESVGGAPEWLHADAFAGINFITAEAFLNDNLITDLTTILGGNFDTSYLTDKGYDMTIEYGGGSPYGGMLCIGDLLTRLQAMDWAFRIEFRVASGLATTLLSMQDGTDTHETYFNSSGNLYSSDYTGDFNVVGNVVTYQAYEDFRIRSVVASSNNAGGWLASLDGETAVLSSPKQTWTPDAISLGCTVDPDLSTIYNELYGVIEKIEWFPLRDATQIEALADVDARPSWLSTDDYGGMDFTAGTYGEYYFGDDRVLVTDLSDILIHDTGDTQLPVQTSRFTADGYDFGDFAYKMANGSFWLRYKPEKIPSVIQSWDWSVRVDLKAAASYYYIGLLAAWRDDGGAWEGVDMYHDTGYGPTGFIVSDYNGDYSHVVGPMTAGVAYEMVTSNNTEGWRTTWNGGVSVLDPTQTEYVAPGCNTMWIGRASLGGIWDGTIKRVIFRANEMDDTAVRAWANETY